MLTVTTSEAAVRSAMTREEKAKALRELADAWGKAAAIGVPRGRYDRRATRHQRRVERTLGDYADAYERGDEQLIAEYEAWLLKAEATVEAVLV